MVGRHKAALGLAVLVATLLGAWWWLRFPPDTTPDGAYMRIARAVSADEPEACFAYLEEDAQHAAFTIVGYAKKATARISAAYPEPARSDTLARFATAAAATDGADAWVRLAAERGWVNRLRADLSGIAEVQIVGERATVTTIRSTRYAFRRRPNGIWGLTMFSAELSAEAERMARDWELIQRDAADYERASAHGDTAPSATPDNRDAPEQR
jgi:hypothetical protein